MNILTLLLKKKSIQQPTIGCCIGDSTVAEFAGGTAIASLLFNQTEITNGYSCTNLAVAGHTIDQQLTVWNAFTNKVDMDWIVVQIGLNDLNPADSLSAALGRYQNLINTINSTKKVDAKVILATMIPCKERLFDAYTTNGEVSYQKWLSINDAIMGGANSITGVDHRMSDHTALLNDGNGNLLPQYDTGDHIHENTAAREIIASVWRDGLRYLKLYA